MKNILSACLPVWMSLVIAGCATNVETERGDADAQPPSENNPTINGIAEDVGPPPEVDSTAPDRPMDVESRDLPDDSVSLQPSVEVGAPLQPVDDVAPESEPMASGNTNRVAAYHDPQMTNLGVEASCAQCHGEDGGGGSGASGRPIGGILGLSADVLAAHIQGNAQHPAPTGRVGIKFPDLTTEDFDAIAAFLSQE